MPDVEGAARVHRDRDDVEAAADVGEPAPLEIELGQLCEPTLLVPGDGRGRCCVPALLPALHLDEDHDVLVTADQVDLARGEADVALHDSEAGTLQEPGGGVLGRAAQRVAEIGHAAQRRGAAGTGAGST